MGHDEQDDRRAANPVSSAVGPPSRRLTATTQLVPRRAVVELSPRGRRVRSAGRTGPCHMKTELGGLSGPGAGSAGMTVETYREDPLYPRVVHAVESILRNGTVVAPVDVLVEMGLLTRARLEDWRCGRTPYLERVIDCNLKRLSRLLRILRFHAHDLNLRPSWTAYMRYGRGPRRRLRFTKTGDLKLEQAYATHLVWPGNGPCPAPASKDVRR